MNAVGPMLFGCVVALDHLLLYPALFSSESPDANGPWAIDLAAEVVESCEACSMATREPMSVAMGRHGAPRRSRAVRDRATAPMPRWLSHVQEHIPLIRQSAAVQFERGKQWIMPKWRWTTGRIPLIQERSRQWIVWRWVARTRHGRSLMAVGIEINRLVHALVRCTDQAKCVEIEARSKSLRASTYLTDRRGGRPCRLAR